ncbi:hypothetical protein A2U01_0013500 [Trifolium medium]|uniref:Uncharacterized protein n=1 Tax=Trifolium medium TaxID=97028 RepID=A0A392MYG4_9FABA|nr:hypothetical protein [Trifolium medium]
MLQNLHNGMDNINVVFVNIQQQLNEVMQPHGANPDGGNFYHEELNFVMLEVNVEDAAEFNDAPHDEDAAGEADTMRRLALLLVLA